MDGSSIAILALVITNIAGVAYSYGRLSQKVNDICQRLSRLENTLNCSGEKK